MKNMARKEVGHRSPSRRARETYMDREEEQMKETAVSWRESV